MSTTDAFASEGANEPVRQYAALDELALPAGEQITVHMVHLNHLDLTWFWRLPDALEMCLETVRWHTDLLESHPDACYSHTQAFILQAVDKTDPELLRRFAALVEGGRVELDSGQVVEPDHNLPAGESLARQFLYGQSYLLSRFGRRARVLVNSDSFGHARSLPQVLRLAGIEAMLFKRPRQKFVKLPESPFLWQGIDGTQVTALRFINKGAGLPSLSQYYVLPEGKSGLQEKVDRNLRAGVHHFFASHCNSDAGGVTAYLAPHAGPGYELRYDTPSGFLAALQAEGAVLPVLGTRFGPLYQGCYTTHVEEKEHCRRAERELRAVELLWTLAALAGDAYPLPDINAAWWRLCFLQFHDIISGTGSPEAHADSSALYHELFLDTLVIRRRAQVLLDQHCAGSLAGRVFLVANPRPSPAGGLVEVDVELPLDRAVRGSAQLPETGWVASEDGQRTPYQLLGKRTFQRYVRGTLAFCARSLSPLGLSRFHLVEGKQPLPSTVCAEGDTISNECLVVRIGGPGIIRSIVARADGREWLGVHEAPVRLELWPETDYPGDYGNPMKAWMLGITGRREPPVYCSGPVAIENGPVRATLRMEHRWASSTFRTDVSLYAGQDWIELRFEIDWQEREVLARLCVEPALRGEPRRIYSIPFGHEEATGEELEVPAAGWADLSGDDGGIAILNQDRPGHSFREHALRVSLVRCATGEFDPRTDGGMIRAMLRLWPHSGPLEPGQAAALADQFSHPPVAWQRSAPGLAADSQESSEIELLGDGIQLTALKIAEDGRGYVFRFYESAGRPTQATLRLPSLWKDSQVHVTNLLEDDIEPLATHDGQIVLSFRPFEITTLVVRPAQSPALRPLRGGLFQSGC